MCIENIITTIGADVFGSPDDQTHYRVEIFSEGDTVYSAKHAVSLMCEAARLLEEAIPGFGPRFGFTQTVREEQPVRIGSSTYRVVISVSPHAAATSSAGTSRRSLEMLLANLSLHLHEYVIGLEFPLPKQTGTTTQDAKRPQTESVEPAPLIDTLSGLAVPALLSILNIGGK